MTIKKGVNPKDALGVKKISLSKFPAIAVLHGAHAMMDGAGKYGPYNWRENAVISSVYVDACKRHLDEWFDSRVDEAEDSEVKHLGHALACIAIILDAEATGNLDDDRPIAGAYAAEVKKLNAKIKARAERKRRAK